MPPSDDVKLYGLRRDEDGHIFTLTYFNPVDPVPDNMECIEVEIAPKGCTAERDAARTTIEFLLGVGEKMSVEFAALTAERDGLREMLRKLQGRLNTAGNCFTREQLHRVATSCYQMCTEIECTIGAETVEPENGGGGVP